LNHSILEQDFDLQLANQVIAHAHVEKAFYFTLIDLLLEFKGLNLLELLQTLVLLL
jgi:hypothetical protein